MKKTYSILFIIVLCISACSKIDYDFDEEYEKAEITGIELYNREMQRADKEVQIDSSTGIINIILKDGEDITDLKLTARLSTGARITPVMSVGYQNLTSPKNYQVISPRETIKKDWTINVKE